MISLNSVRPFCWFHTYYLITTRFRINNAKISRVIILLSNRTLSALKCPVYKGFQKIFIIQTLGRRDLSGCFSVHICVFYSSYSSYFAFLCTSSIIFRAKLEPLYYLLQHKYYYSADLFFISSRHCSKFIVTSFPQSFKCEITCLSFNKYK